MASPKSPPPHDLRTDDLRFLRDLTETRSFTSGQPSDVRLTPDGQTVLFLRGLARKPELRLYAFDVASGQTRALIAPEQILKGHEETLPAEERARRERMRIKSTGFTSYALSRDGKTVLVTLSGRAYVLPTAGGVSREVAGPDAEGRAIFDPQLSPDGASVAFVRGGELWVAGTSPGSGARQLTTGATALKTHAQAEFVAQEEFGRFHGFWWSPDSKHLLFEEADASGVPTIALGDPARLEVPAVTTPYPRPGQPNAKVRFGIVAATGGMTTWIDLDFKHYEYAAKVFWPEGGPPSFFLVTRDQRDLALAVADAASGRVKTLIHEHDDAWINTERAYRWLPDGFLWSSEKNGEWQLFLHKPGGEEVRALTKPALRFTELLHVDAAAKKIIVLAKAEPVESQLYEVSLTSGEAKALTRGPASHAATYAREQAVSVRASWSLAEAKKVEVIRADSTVAGALPSVAEKPPFAPRVEVKKAGDFWTSLVRPRDFDAKKKYPIIVQVYGGPHHLQVQSSQDAYLIAQWIADHGYLVFSADGRGTPGRGRAFERAIENRFFEVPLADQVAALAALAATEPAMDLKRVGVIGGSFGGYMAALSVMRRPDVYKAGVAVSSVVDWMNYDTAYTERYLGVPPPAGQSAVYPQNGLAAYAAGLTRPLLIMHGTADDNVHFSESLLLADMLFQAGKHFEFVPLVGETHQPHEPQRRMRYWQRVFDFFAAHL